MTSLSEKIELKNDTDFEMAMGMVSASFKTVAMFDWDKLIAQIEHAEGAGAVLNPQLFLDIQRDPQWETKKKIFRACSAFVKAMEEARDEAGLG